MDSKEQLLSFLKQGLEADINNLPNVVFIRHLKNQLEEQAEKFGWIVNGMSGTIDAVLGNMGVDFSAFGLECSKENNEYLLELATLVAKFVWKMYNVIPDNLGWNVFINQIKGFSFSVTT